MKKKSEDKNISRREALIKTGKYAAATAVATFIILNPKQSQADSPSHPGWSKAPERRKGDPETEDQTNKS